MYEAEMLKSKEEILADSIKEFHCDCMGRKQIFKGFNVWFKHKASPSHRSALA